MSMTRAPASLDSAAEGVRGGGGADAGEEDSAEDAVRAILRTWTDDQSKQVAALLSFSIIIFLCGGGNH